VIMGCPATIRIVLDAVIENVASVAVAFSITDDELRVVHVDPLLDDILGR